MKIPQEDGEVHTDYKDSAKAIQIVKDFNEGRIISKIKFCAPVVVRVLQCRDKDGVRVRAWDGKETLVESHLEGRYDKFVFGNSTDYHPSAGRLQRMESGCVLAEGKNSSNFKLLTSKSRSSHKRI